MSMTQEDSHLNSLSIAHYVVGALMMFFACMPLIHFTIGLLFVIGKGQGWFVDREEPEPPEFLGWIFMAVGASLFLLGQAAAVCVILSGKFLKKRVKYMFSFVVACFSCFFMPFGTILGVFTIIVMIKPEVKAIYKAQNPDAQVL